MRLWNLLGERSGKEKEKVTKRPAKVNSGDILWVDHAFFPLQPKPIYVCILGIVAPH